MAKKGKKNKQQQKKNVPKNASGNVKSSQSSAEFQADSEGNLNQSKLETEAKARGDEFTASSSSKSNDVCKNLILDEDVEEKEQGSMKYQASTGTDHCVPRSPLKKIKQETQTLKNQNSSHSSDEFEDATNFDYNQKFRYSKQESQRSRSSSKTRNETIEVNTTSEDSLRKAVSHINGNEKDKHASMKYQNTGRVHGQSYSRNFSRGRQEKNYENSSNMSNRSNSKQKHKHSDDSGFDINASGEWRVEDGKNESPSRARPEILQSPKDVMKCLREYAVASLSPEREYEEFEEFNKKWKKFSALKKITEKNCDLFWMPEDYSLGHCVAADLRMGAGIALTFRQNFNRVDELQSQNQKAGGLAILQSGQRFIYYLITKHISTRKPTSFFLWKSLQKLKQHIVKNNVKKLALPKIGCGLDGMDWNYAKSMLEYIFQDVDVELCICSIKHEQSKLENFGFKFQSGFSGTNINNSSKDSKQTTESTLSAWDDNPVVEKIEPRFSNNVSRKVPQGFSSKGNKFDEDDWKISSDGKMESMKDEHFSEYMPINRTIVNSYRDRSSSRQRHDAAFDKFEPIMRSKSNFNFVRVQEIQADLFAMSKEYALGHCVAEDMNMGSGIAVLFRQQFKKVDDLLNQRQRQGGLAVLNTNGRYIYYLVTKRTSSGKPTYLTFWTSLHKMKKHILENQVKKLALPRIGCGLDALEWCYVKKMLEHIFTDVDVEITICNFQQDTDSSLVTPLSVKRKNKVVNDPRVITELEDWSIIIYLGSEDGYVTDEIKSLDKKFNIESAYKRGVRKVGETIRTEKGHYILYGFIVRKKKNDFFGYCDFQKCLNFVQKSNVKDEYSYIGLQAFEEKNDKFIMSKIVNLMRNTLTHVDIYICWPPELNHCMPKNM